MKNRKIMALLLSATLGLCAIGCSDINAEDTDPSKGKRLQYYLIANKNSAFPSEKNDMKQSKTFDNSAFWTWLNSMK